MNLTHPVPLYNVSFYEKYSSKVSYFILVKYMQSDLF